MHPNRTIHYDYLVLGSGIAGLYAALLAAQHGSVCVLSKGPLAESNSARAQGGIAAAVGPGDSPAQHLDDTIRAGAGLCDRAAVELLVQEAPARVRNLIELGVPFDTAHGAVALGTEAAHSTPRILHAGGDRTGAAIEQVMVDRATEAGVTLLEQHTVTDLLIEKGRCIGAQARTPPNNGGGDTITATAGWTILATGGAGQLYTLTTNSPVVTGDGIALAFRAGAVVRDLEFVQFHPTALALPRARAFLISEALRGEGARLLATDGRRFMPGYHPDAELAPRDIVARAIVAEMQRTGCDHVLLDITQRDPAFVAARFPGIHQHCLTYELDITRTPIPVAPAAHYLMGGVLTDTWGRTTLPGLLACGEVASSGVHGANRLASNSLLETVVFSQRAVEATLQTDGAPPPLPTDAQPLAFPRTAPPDRATLQALLWEHAGILRDHDGLRAAAALIDAWPAPTNDAAAEPATLPAMDSSTPARSAPAPAALALPAIERRNMSTVARLIVQAALHRRESRGAHFRRDFPQPAADWQRHLSYRLADPTNQGSNRS